MADRTRNVTDGGRELYIHPLRPNAGLPHVFVPATLPPARNTRVTGLNMARACPRAPPNGPRITKLRLTITDRGGETNRAESDRNPMTRSNNK